MSPAQSLVLQALRAGARRIGTIALATGGNNATVQHTLDALYRRSWVTITDDGGWLITERGAAKLEAYT